MTVGVFLDFAVAAILVIGAVGGVAITRKLNRLMKAQQELKIALDSFELAAGRADAALKRLEAGGIAKGAELQSAAARAEALVNELSVMASAGERIAERIEAAVSDVRAIGASRGAKPKRAA